MYRLKITKIIINDQFYSQNCHIILSTHTQAVGSKSYFSLIPNGPLKDPEPCYDCYSCAIEMTDKVILTLGKIPDEDQPGQEWVTDPNVAGRAVQEYGSQGPGARLPDLLVGRENHACGFYVNSNSKIVGINKYLFL